MEKLKIGILGAGKVGRALGNSWVLAGHIVNYGIRDPNSPAAQRLKEDHSTRALSVASATQGSDIIVLGIPSGQIEMTLSQVGDLTAKTIFDCSNPQSPAVHHQELPPYTLVEKLAGEYPTARFVKIFNTVGFEVLGNPLFEGLAASMFYCCDGQPEGEAASRLASDAGFEPVKVGGLKQARMLEDLTRFWGALAYGAHHGRGIALKLLRREERS